MDEALIARCLKDGRGTGLGADYKPWPRISDVPSLGRSHRSPIMAAKPVRELVAHTQIAQAAYLVAASYFGGPQGAATASATLASIQGGSVTDMGKAAAIAYATAAAFNAVGTETGFHGATWSHAMNNPGAFAANIAGHAAIGCASTAAQGGNCGNGALAAGFSAAATPAIAGLPKEFRLVSVMVVGGTGSVLGGGKFQNGAVTAAFGYLFNQAAGALAAPAAAAGAGAAAVGGVAGAAVGSLSGDTASYSDPQYVIRGGLASPDNLIAGSGPVRTPYDGLTGFSVTTGPALTVDQLARVANYPNGQISVTTVQELAKVGVTVTPTPFTNMPLHATAVVPTPLDPARAAAISALFQRIPNPARQ